jgi:O-antigen/teichoic acid export membrane protein
MIKLDTIKNTVSNKNSFLHYVLTLTSGTVLAQAITIVASPVLTRLYSPEEMGVLASLLAVTMILGSIAAGRYDQAIVLPKSETEATAVAFVGILISASTGLLVTLIFIWFGGWLGPVLGLKHVPRQWMDLIGFMVFLIGIEQIRIRLCIRGRKFKVLASTQVTQQLLANGVKIGLGFAHFGVGGFFLVLFLEIC